MITANVKKETMGRITVFSRDDCCHCTRSAEKLRANSIPFVAISLSAYPEKRADMVSLSNCLTVPQVFFNDEYIGGADDLSAFLSKWESKEEALDYYKQEVESKPDPVDKRLEQPTTPPEIQRLPPPRDQKLSVVMPDGSLQSVLEVTEMLQKILPCENNRRVITEYKRSFHGSDAIRAFRRHFPGLLQSNQDACRFGDTLVAAKIIKRANENKATRNNAFEANNTLYRLTCHQSPHILNSFRIWTERVEPDSMILLQRLRCLLGRVENALTNKEGLVNYKNAQNIPDFAVFEEAVCELQGVDLGKMKRNMRMAFCINVYNLMIKYAFMKVGIGKTAMSRRDFFSKVKMNIGGDILSFNDIENGILRGKKFSSDDPRRRLALEETDCRIHFALNCGANGCPPVMNFTAGAIEEELRIVAQAFCETDDNVRICSEKNTLYLSKIFFWYRSDFTSVNRSLSDQILSYLRGTRKEKLEGILNKSEKPITVKFMSYDWGTNASAFVPFESSSLKTTNTIFF